MRKTLSDRGVAALKPRHQRFAYADPELRGHYVRVYPSGAKSFAAVTSAPDGKQVWTTIGAADVITVEQAREQARVILRRVRAGLPAIEPKAETFGEVTANWLKRHVTRNALRSRAEIERVIERYILPAWRAREFTAIRKSDIAALLDKIEDNHGARTADYCLSIIHRVMHWVAARHDDYSPPVMRAMRRQSTKAQARARTLDDDEIRAFWAAAEASGTFGAILQLCLLSAQRSRKVASTRWADISDAGEWTVPKEAREKDSGGVLVLPELALAIIRAQPQLGDSAFVFAGRAAGPFRGFSKSKRKFDVMLPPGTLPWVIHDLRRTARSLMSRAGVRPDIAERVLGHVIGGIEGVYDRHAYKAEKADALARLAALIQDILREKAGDNVTRLPAKRRQSR